ncbi:unnamed protein product [Fraxinus pennsylvanica]|uniref:Uncharacterized protein n=1 Tax=Fraxinus pennsylvanica TaxID=56036 RepID=A0AAD2A6B6_9LAMI|nr:unnamed protein product [Fraxinus pennsylvanica]
MDDNNLMGKNLVDLDLNLEHLDLPLNSDSRFGSMLNELETTHGRIEERIRELEAAIARASVMESIFKQGSGWAYVQVNQRYRQYHHCSGSTNNLKAIPAKVVELLSQGVASSHANPCTPAHIQAKEADVQALTELTRTLDKKVAIVLELRHMNDDVLENQKDGDGSLKESEQFKKQYICKSKQSEDSISKSPVPQENRPTKESRKRISSKNSRIP